MKFQRYIGKQLKDICDQAEIDCKKNGYSFSILDPDFQQNIDKDDTRMNFLIRGV